MRRLLLIAALALMTSMAHAQNVTGDWSGTLNAGKAQLRLNLHITQAADGTLHATLDSVDQNAMGIPVESVVRKGEKLTLDVPAVHGRYEGTLGADANSIEGTWTQSVSLPLKFTRATAQPQPKPAAPSNIDGTWLGLLDTGSMELRVAFHITNTSDGLKASMDSLDQGAKGIPVTSVTYIGESLKLQVGAVGGSYSGTVSKDLQTIAGTWSQNGASLPLVLKRVKEVAQLGLPRPQEPKPPFPYRSEDVTYENRATGFTLAGTLTVPRGTPPFPAVVLLAGSGPQDRDETVMGHKPFLVLSDYLTRKGVIALRADDRGVGKSGGSFRDSTTADFATDAAAGVAFLRSRVEVDRQKIGLIGHSEGAIEAAMVAARDPDIAFIILMAGPGVPGDKILVEQSRLIAQVRGASPEAAQKVAEKEREVLAVLKSGKDDAATRRGLHDVLGGNVPDAAVAAEVTQLMSPWFRYFINYDPATVLVKVKCPVLAIDGSKDVQVSPTENLTAIRAALDHAGNHNIETVEFPGLNHLFQHAVTGAPSEYAEIKETVAPEVLEKIGSWILER